MPSESIEKAGWNALTLIANNMQNKHGATWFDLEACKAMLKRDQEVERACAPGRHKEADTQMKGYASAFGAVLNICMPEMPPETMPPRPSLTFNEAANFQRAVVKEMRTQQAGGHEHVVEPSLEELLELQRRNGDKESGACVSLPLDDVLQGPGHTAWKLIQSLKEDPAHGIEFNEEQLLVIALQIWPLEQAWRSQRTGAGATLDSMRWLPNDLGLPRMAVIGGGGCGKTTIMQLVVVPILSTFFQRVVLTAPSNRAARGFDPRAKTLHSVAGMRPQDSMRTASLNIKNPPDAEAHGGQPDARRRLGARRSSADSRATPACRRPKDDICQGALLQPKHRALRRAIADLRQDVLFRHVRRPPATAARA